MIRIDFDRNITVSKGDSVTLQLKFNRNILSTEYVIFTVKKQIGDTTPEIDKHPAGGGSNTLNITFSHSDTDLEIGQYWYDIRIVSGSVSSPTVVETPFEPKKFIVIDVVKDW